jgi:hypothetical protein
LTYSTLDPLTGYRTVDLRRGERYVIEDDQWPIDTSNGVIADARLDGGHPGIHDFGGHDCGPSTNDERKKKKVKGVETCS